MCKLSETFEKSIKLPDGTIQHQVLVISAEANNREEAAALGYDDFKMDLFINGKFIADISPVIGKTEGFEKIVDETQWEEKFYTRKVNITIHETINY